MEFLRGVVILTVCAFLAVGTAHGQEQPPADATYVVKSGDTLYSIAQRFGVSVERLQQMNDLSDTNIEVGQTLVVRPPESPTPSDTTIAGSDTADADTTTAAAASDSAIADTERAQADVEEEAAASSIEAFGTEIPSDRTLTGDAINWLAYGAYVIRPGDTFYSVAARLGTTGDSLFALNGQHTDPLPPGRVLRLPPRFALPSHEVRPQDSTLYAVAAEYGVSARALQRANDLDSMAVRPGTRLRIPGRTAPEPAPRGTLPPAEAQGPVAVYPASFEGRLTASGTPYDPDQPVVSHPDLPFGSVVLLTNPATDRSTFARVIDRGPVEEALLVDVSAAVAEQLELAPESDQPLALRIVQ